MKLARLTCLLLVLLAEVLALGTQANAQSIKRIGDNVTVTPAKYDLNGNPGETIKQALRITNDDDHEALYAISLENFNRISEDGEVILGENPSNIPSHLASWISFDKIGGVLEPHQTTVINYEVKIPSSADPGGAYAAIVISMDRVIRQPGESAASSRVVSIVMLTVAGDIREKASVESLSKTGYTDHNGRDKIDFAIRVKNTGNNHIKPSGTIVIRNLLGKQVDEFPLSSENVLPGATRRMVTTWQPNRFLFGWYTATVTAHFGQQQNKPLIGSMGFPVVPWWGIVVLLALLGASVYSTRRFKIRLPLSR